MDVLLGGVDVVYLVLLLLMRDGVLLLDLIMMRLLSLSLLRQSLLGQELLRLDLCHVSL